VKKRRRIWVVVSHRAARNSLKSSISRFVNLMTPEQAAAPSSLRIENNGSTGLPRDKRGTDS